MSALILVRGKLAVDLTVDLTVDRWQLHTQTSALPSSLERTILPLALFSSHRATLLGQRIGVWIEGAADPAALANDYAQLPLVAVHIPQFTDGRAYSTARLIRERYGFRGELRAIGDVHRDQLWELSRCGFDAFVLRAGDDPSAAQNALQTFSDAYQASTAQPQPLFRRRVAHEVS